MGDRNKLIHNFAIRYHTECESYDRTVCTGPIELYGIVPANVDEMRLINKNAGRIRKNIEKDAAREGISKEELARAIVMFAEKNSKNE